MWLDAPAYFVGGSVNVEVTVRNDGERDVEKVPIKLYADGRERALATVDIAAGASTRVVLRFTLDRAGWVDGRVDIDDYPIVFDDSWCFALSVGDKIAAAEVHGKEAGESLSRLFDGDSSVVYQSLPRVPASLEDIGFLVLNEVSDLTSGEGQQLASWVAEGGSLLVVPTAERCQSAVGMLLGAMQAPVPDRWVARTVRAKEVDCDNSLYREVFTGRDDEMEMPTVQGHYQFAGATVGQTIISLVDGGSMLSVTPYGAGKVYLFSMPLRDVWTDFASQALFVPTIYNMALYSRPQPSSSHVLGAAGPIVLHGSYDLGAKLPELMAPDSSKGIISDIRKVGNRSVLFLHGELTEAGVYRLSGSSQQIEHIAFNYPRRESVMDFMSSDELKESVDGMAGYSVIQNAKKPLGDELRERDGGMRLWRLCVVLALLALAVETALLKIRNK
jgi:hypothetical protein